LDVRKNRIENLQKDLNELHKRDTAIAPEYTLDQLVALALSRSIDILYHEQEYEIQKEIATKAKLTQLPSLTASFDSSMRSPPMRSTASSFAADGKTPIEKTSVEYSQSTPKENQQFSLGAAWNVLDFGLTYLRTRQEQNQLLILRQRQLRLRQNLILNVTEYYWKASVFKYALQKSTETLAKTKELQKAINKQIQAKTISEVVGLQIEDQILQMQAHAHHFKVEYEKNLTVLISHLQLPPGTDLNIKGFDKFPELKGRLDIDVANLEEQALLNRPELFEQDIKQVIDIDETKQSLLRMFPNVSLFADLNYSKNKYLLHHAWLDLGAKTAWNLLSLPQQLHNFRSNKLGEDLTKQARLSLSMGVLSQLRLAYLLYDEAISTFEITQRLFQVKQRRLAAAQKSFAEGQTYEMEIIELQAETLFAEINSLNNFAEAQIGLEKIANTVGIPMLFSDINVSKIAERLSYGKPTPVLLTNTWLQWENPKQNFKKYPKNKIFSRQRNALNYENHMRGVVSQEIQEHSKITPFNQQFDSKEISFFQAKPADGNVIDKEDEQTPPNETQNQIDSNIDCNTGAETSCENTAIAKAEPQITGNVIGAIFAENSPTTELNLQIPLSEAINQEQNDLIENEKEITNSVLYEHLVIIEPQEESNQLIDIVEAKDCCEDEKQVPSKKPEGSGQPTAIEASVNETMIVEVALVDVISPMNDNVTDLTDLLTQAVEEEKQEDLPIQTSVENATLFIEAEPIAYTPVDNSLPSLNQSTTIHNNESSTSQSHFSPTESLKEVEQTVEIDVKKKSVEDLPYDVKEHTLEGLDQSTSTHYPLKIDGSETDWNADTPFEEDYKEDEEFSSSKETSAIESGEETQSKSYQSEDQQESALLDLPESIKQVPVEPQLVEQELRPYIFNIAEQPNTSNENEKIEQTREDKDPQLSYELVGEATTDTIASTEVDLKESYREKDSPCLTPQMAATVEEKQEPSALKTIELGANTEDSVELPEEHQIEIEVLEDQASENATESQKDYNSKAIHETNA
jgi:outer membrane protein TolC